MRCVYSEDGIYTFRKLSVVSSFLKVNINTLIYQSNKINKSILASFFIINIIQNYLSINNLNSKLIYLANYC